MIKFKKIVVCDVPNCDATAEMDYPGQNRNALPSGWMQSGLTLYCAECVKKLGLDANWADARSDVPTTP